MPSSCTSTRIASPSAAAETSTRHALGRVLDCVREQVPDHLPESVGVARARATRPLADRGELVLRALEAVERGLVAQQHRQVDDLPGALEATLLDARHVEEVVDELGQPACLRIDDAQVVPTGLGVEFSRKKELGEPEHAGKGRSQLVGDGVHEIRLQAFALAELRFCSSSSIRACSKTLGHPVERRGELADLARAALREAQGKIARGKLGRSYSCLAHRPCDRPGRGRSRRGE